MPTVNIMPMIRNQYLNDNGVPLAGGKIYTLMAGMPLSPLYYQTTYQDANGLIPHANPVVLDAGGRATVYLDDTAAYKIILEDENGNIVWTEDGVTMSSIVTDVETMEGLRALTPGATSFVRVLGYHTPNDKGGWIYYWDAASELDDDGGMVIQDDGLTAIGRWIGIEPNDGRLNVRVYGAVCDGTTDDIAELQACDDYCAANNLMIMVDSNIYVSTDPSLVAKLYLLPGAQFRYGNFNPTIKLAVGIDDATQHFNCSATYYPILVTSFIIPEWFGEVYNNHPIATACFNASISTRKVMFTGILATNNAEMN